MQVTFDNSQVVAARTTDGKLFTDRAQFEAHQAYLDLGKVLEQDSLPGNYAGSRVELDTLAHWLSANKDAVLRFLQNR